MLRDPMYTDDILILLRKYAPLLVAHIVLGTLVGLIIAAASMPVYTSEASALVAAEGIKGANNVSSVSTITTGVMPTLVEIGASDSVLTQVAESTGVDQAKVKHAVSVTNTENSLILEVTADASSAAEAQAIAAAEVEALREVIEGMSVRGQEETPLTLADIDEASLPSSPSGPSKMRYSLYGAVLGTVIGISVVLLLNQVSRTTDAHGEATADQPNEGTTRTS